MRQNSAAVNTNLSRPIQKVSIVCELMCTWISVFL